MEKVLLTVGINWDSWFQHTIVKKFFTVVFGFITVQHSIIENFPENFSAEIYDYEFENICSMAFLKPRND
jgi:hypothetical protein